MTTELFLLHVTLGLTLAAHGAQKRLGWFWGFAALGVGSVGAVLQLAQRREPATAR